MTWAIEQARTRIGLDSSDPSRDADLNAAMRAAEAVAEKWCDRGLIEALDATEESYKLASNTLRLFRYPVASVASVTLDGDVADAASYTVLGRIGELLFEGMQCAEVVSVEYSAGYSPLPPDVELALWSLFDSVWEGLENAGGFVGQIRSESVSGVGSVSYVVADGEDVFVGPAAAAMLDPYKRMSA